MKKLIVVIVLLSFCGSLSGFAYTQLLNQDDIDFQDFNNARGSALASTLESNSPWESYNQWKCFSVDQISYDCADYNHGTLVPSLRVETDQEILFFDVYIEDRLQCAQTLSEWRTLIEGGKEVCLFAANLPDVDMDLDRGKPQSLWYISLLKGVDGYWSIFEESSGHE